MNLIQDIATNNLDKLAIVNGDNALTYGHLYKLINDIAQELKDQNTQTGDRVALLGLTNFELLVSYYGCLAIGAVPVPVPF